MLSVVSWLGKEFWNDVGDRVCDLRALAGVEATAYCVRMKTVTVTAHFDGEHIQLDEPFALHAGSLDLGWVG